MNNQQVLQAIRERLEAEDKPEYAPLLNVVREEYEWETVGESSTHRAFFNRSWEGQPPGALRGAIDYAVSKVGLGFEDKYHSWLRGSDPDAAALSALCEALGIEVKE